MALVTRNTLKNWFVTAAKPTQEQFWAWLDSYWHKDDSIPTSKITGLDDLFAGVATTEALEAKANKNATNISATDREAWRTKLGVGDLPADLVHTSDLADYYTIPQTDNLLSEKLDYPAAEIDSSIIPTQLVGLDAVGNSVQINPNYFASTGDLDDGLDTKIDKPTTTLPSPSATYKYVPLLDSAGNSTQMLAGDLGKNIANTNLTQVDAERTFNINGGSLTFSNGAVKSANLIVTGGSVNATQIGATTPSTGQFTTLQTTGAGTFAGANTFSNASQKFSGLTNKRTDSTYNRLLGMDSNGNANEVGLYAMTNEMSQATDAQKDAWRIASRKTGETYSTGQPRVDAIMPKIITKQIAGVQYVSLVGLNLFINNTSVNTSVTLINTTDNSEYAISEVQVTQTNQQVLVFGIDWSTIPDGTYKVRVINNGLQNIDSTTFSVISSDLVYTDLSELTWEKYTENGTFSTSFGEGNYAFRDANAYSGVGSFVSKTARGLLLVSGDVLNNTEANGNWWIKIVSDIPAKGLDYFGDTYVGIIDSSSSSSSIQTLQPLYGLKLTSNSSSAFPDNTDILGMSDWTGSIITHIIKQGSIITVLVIINNTTYKSVSFSVATTFNGLKLMLGCGVGNHRTYDSNWKIGNTFKITKF